MTLDEVLQQAADQVPAIQANAAIAERRGDSLLSYEVVLPEGKDVDWLREHTLPRLVYFLDSRGFSLVNEARAFVSMFKGDRLYFFEVGTFVTALKGDRSPADLVDAYGVDAEQSSDA